MCHSRSSILLTHFPRWFHTSLLTIICDAGKSQYQLCPIHAQSFLPSLSLPNHFCSKCLIITSFTSRPFFKRNLPSQVLQEIFLCFPSGYDVIFFLLTPTTLATSHIWLVALSCITVICLYLTYQTKGFLRQKLLTPLPHSSSCLAHCLTHSRCTEPMFLVEENWTYQ